jgi:putative addiction module CopG family antidote
MAIEINLSPALAAFVKGRVQDGLYASEQDVIADAVRRLAGGEFDDSQRAYLRQAWQEGLDSPLEGDFDVDAILKEVQTEAQKRQAA